MPKVVLVTGVGRPIGARLVAKLATESDIERIIAVDMAPVAGALPDKAQFFRADIRSPAIARLLKTEKVDTVAHINVTGVPDKAGRRAANKELNVIGTMQLLAACQRAPHVKKIVLRSSTAIYGSSQRDPALFTEETEAASEILGYGKDTADVESYVRGFSRRRPDAQVTVLRLANVLAPDLHTPFGQYFCLPAVPTILGFDPRLQFLHLDDALEVFQRAVREDHPGIFNVAGSGVVLLSQAIRRAGRVPLPSLRFTAPLLAQLSGIELSAEQVQLLTYGRVVDTTKLRDTFGYTPTFSSRQTFDDFVRGRDLSSVLSPDNIAAVERALRSQLLGQKHG
ncbi:MAG: NAD-dependent epimerase/dehydratase family protein [Corynebacteriales bacterium]|nr:NAD-dependent epimerase/dehydratase family protein [Mycobacteriales bacterium]